MRPYRVERSTEKRRQVTISYIESNVAYEVAFKTRKCLFKAKLTAGAHLPSAFTPAASWATGQRGHSLPNETALAAGETTRPAPARYQEKVRSGEQPERRLVAKFACNFFVYMQAESYVHLYAGQALRMFISKCTFLGFTMRLERLQLHVHVKPRAPK